jgi:hypothetical protein
MKKSGVFRYIRIVSFRTVSCWHHLNSNTVVLSPTEYTDYRVPGFPSSRPNWYPPNPSPTSEYCSPPVGSGGGGEIHSLAGEGGGGPNSDDEGTDTLVLHVYFMIPLRCLLSLSYLSYLCVAGTCYTEPMPKTAKSQRKTVWIKTRKVIL